MLEYWYKEKRTLVDFRRGPLGPYFDDFAAHLKVKGYSSSAARGILGKSCQFNSFLLEKKISKPSKISVALIESFLETYHGSIRELGSNYTSVFARRSLKSLFEYLVEMKLVTPLKPKPVIKPHTWLMNRYLRHLRSERELSEKTIGYHSRQLDLLLNNFGKRATRSHFKKIKAEIVEGIVRSHLRTTKANPGSLAGVIRSFLYYCAKHRYLRADFSGLVPTVRHYRYASLPKGLADSGLEMMLKKMNRETPVGARDYAIVIIMMAYGIRGISAAQLLLDDIDWRQSRIRIRAQKGGKEVVLPLMEAVGDAIIQYLRHRPVGTPFREVFLSTKAPVRPLDSGAIAVIVRNHLERAGIKTPGTGVRTLRHSWAIRALAHDSTIKAIADVLGHRYIDTTFIYAKADLKSLREVALPWPDKKHL